MIKRKQKIEWKPVEQRKDFWNYTKRLIFVLLAALIYFIAVQWFILGKNGDRHTNFLSTGISGTLLAVVNIFPKTTNWYFLMQLGVNIPLLIYSWFSLGKITTIYTAIFIAVQYVYSFIPDPFIFGKPGNDPSYYSLELLSGLIAGVLGAIGSTINYVNGSTLGGTDVFIFNIQMKKDKQIGKLNTIFNAILLTLAFGFMTLNSALRGQIHSNYLQTLLFTVFGTFVYIVTYGFALDYVYPKGKRLAVFIILSNDKKEIFDDLLKTYQFKRTYTEFEAIGGRDRQDKIVLITVLTALEYPQFKEIIKSADPHAFVFSTQIKQLTGNFNKFKFD